jgi:putative ABC transport system permease protein
VINIIYWRVALRNLKRHWRQSTAAILSITAGFFALSIFGGYLDFTEAQVFYSVSERMMYGDVLIEKKGAWSPQGRSEPGDFQMGKAEQDFLKDTLDSLSEVRAWSRSLRVSGLASNPDLSWPFVGIGYDLSKGGQIRGPGWYWHTAYGTPLEEAKTPAVVMGVSLGEVMGCLPLSNKMVVRVLRGYAEAVDRPFKCKYPDIQFTSSTATGQMSVVDLPVAGLFYAGQKEFDVRFLFMPLEQAQSLAHTDKISFVSLGLKEPEKIKEFVKKLQSLCDQKGLNLLVQDWRDHVYVGDNYRRIMGLLGVYRNFLTLIIMVIATLSVLNTMVKIVKERTREIGTWRSIGYKNIQIVQIFVAEATLLGLLGCLMGAVSCLIITYAINHGGLWYKAGMFSEPIPFNIGVSAPDYIKSIFILVAVCAVSAFVATRGILKEKICDNLISK